MGTYRPVRESALVETGELPSAHQSGRMTVALAEEPHTHEPVDALRRLPWFANAYTPDVTAIEVRHLAEHLVVFDPEPDGTLTAPTG